jgi:hypothetical protein
MGRGELTFFVGLHQPSDARHFDRSFISVNRLRARKSPFAVGEWIMDSGAFTEISKFGQWRSSVDEYAALIRLWKNNGKLIAAVAQDYMCEPFILAKTGLTVADHQRLTIDRYRALLACDVGGVYIMPVLQGYAPGDYVESIRMYGVQLAAGAWVGVGSVCKRNGDAGKIIEVLAAIWAARPDLKLHGFGLKTTALRSGLVRSLLHSADSMAWSYSARKQGRNGNCWTEAEAFRRSIDTMPVQRVMQF